MKKTSTLEMNIGMEDGILPEASPDANSLADFSQVVICKETTDSTCWERTCGTKDVVSEADVICTVYKIWSSWVWAGSLQALQSVFDNLARQIRHAFTIIPYR